MPEEITARRQGSAPNAPGWRAGLTVVAVLSLLSTGQARAAALDVEPGSWEMSSTTSNPMTGQPQTFTVTECVSAESMDPESFLKGAQGCSLSDVQSNSSAMSWTMTCQAPGGQMTGRANIETSGGGKQVNGTMKMTMDVGGQSMELSTAWTGRWVGPCN